MKKFFLSAIIIFTAASMLHAADLVFTRNGQPESSYDIAQSTVQFSSFTVVTVGAAVYGYRQMIIRDVTESTSFFYRLDGSTNNITTVGMLNKATEICTIESNAAIYVQLAAGVAAKVFNVLTFRK